MRILLVTMLVSACAGSAPQNLCDSAQLTFTCSYTNGQCVEFTGLSTADRGSASGGCSSRSGTALAGACPTGGRLGTCTIPPTGAHTDVSCSPNGHIDIRYFAPYAQSDAKTACTGVTGAVWTPN